MRLLPGGTEGDSPHHLPVRFGKNYQNAGSYWIWINFVMMQMQE
jgi:hypothetical protein